VSAGEADIDEEIEAGKRRSDLVHERLRASPGKRWLLLDGSRYALTGLFSAIVFTACVAIGLAGYIPVTDPATATTLVAAIVGGTLPFITIVPAINQLALSQELGWPGDLDDRYEGMVAFRRAVEGLTGTPVSPAAPADFLQLLVDTVVEQAEGLTVAAKRMGDPEQAAVVRSFVTAVTTEGALVSESLKDANFGTFDALSAVLGRFNGAHLYAVRQLRADYTDEFPAETLGTLDRLVELLQQLAVARQTFKTLYMQHELAHLSKLLLAVGFPTLLGGGIFMMSYPVVVSAVGNPTLLVLVVSAVVTLVFLPFVVLLVYTFRIASIASRTADFGPFVPCVEFAEMGAGSEE
jgi:VIT1/CCC1 family predicted Fe2+/Mn2+ transporter